MIDNKTMRVISQPPCAIGDKVPQTQPQHEDTPLPVDRYEPRGAILPRNAEILLASTHKAIRLAKSRSDAGYLSTERMDFLELAVQTREIRIRLREMQERHDQGFKLSESEMRTLRRELHEVDVALLCAQTAFVTDILADQVDYMLFDLSDVLENNADFSSLLFRSLSDEACAALEALGVIERAESQSPRITDVGFQILKDALKAVLKD